MNTITHNGVEYPLPAYFQYGDDSQFQIKVIAPDRMILVNTYDFNTGVSIDGYWNINVNYTPSSEETFLLALSRAMEAINSVLPVKTEQP